MNNKNFVMFRNGLLGLGLLIGASFVHAEDTKMTAKNADAKAKAATDKKTVDFAKFNKESSRLNLEHLEKMRALSIKNVNTMFDRMIANQKTMDKMSEEAAKSKTPPDMQKFKAKNEEMKKEGDKAQAEFQALNKAEDDKFQAMMKKRQEDMSKGK